MQRTLATPLGRLVCWLEMTLVDHGFFRAVYPNLYQVAPGIYRSSQPSPAQIRRYRRDFGLRSIINLRGAGNSGHYLLEAETCAELGITLVNHRLYSREAPTHEELHTALRLLDELERPLLFHCKSGADRAGLMAALVRLSVTREGADAALGELAWRYGHFDAAATGVLDQFLRSYRDACRKAPVDFVSWLDQTYDDKALQAAFRPRPWARFLTDTVLRRE